jgi:hypothetical protein
VTLQTGEKSLALAKFEAYINVGVRHRRNYGWGLYFRKGLTGAQERPSYPLQSALFLSLQTWQDEQPLTQLHKIVVWP